jgi:hypothetical protein
LPGQQDSFLYLLFSRIHFPSNLSFIHYWVHTHFLSTHLPTTPPTPCSHLPFSLLPPPPPCLLSSAPPPQRGRRCCCSSTGGGGSSAEADTSACSSSSPRPLFPDLSLSRSPPADLPARRRNRGEEDAEHRWWWRTGSRM